MWTRREAVAVAISVLTTAWTTKAHAQLTSAVATLCPTGKLRAALIASNPVLVTRRPGGTIGGVSVDVARALAAHLGVPIELKAYDTPARYNESLATDEWDIGIAARDPARADHLAFSVTSVLSPGVVIGERCAHGVDRNPGYEAREKEPGETNPDRKCARERLPRYDVPVTNREAGDEGEIDRVADRPALHKADQQTQGDLNRQNCRQHRPRKMNGVAEGHEKAPPHALWRPPVHAYSYVSVRFRYSRPSPNSKVAQKLLP
jgi:Bacterial extracellular solute-binding proteins, family 3